MSERIVWKNGRPMSIGTAHLIDELMREADMATRKPKRRARKTKRATPKLDEMEKK